MTIHMQYLQVNVYFTICYKYKLKGMLHTTKIVLWTCSFGLITYIQVTKSRQTYLHHVWYGTAGCTQKCQISRTIFFLSIPFLHFICNWISYFHWAWPFWRCNNLRNTEQSPHFILNSTIRYVVSKNEPLNPIPVHITHMKSSSISLR
jgi:hypothetical protein